MDIGKIYIIDEWDESSMISMWTEYLCLQKLDDSNYELSIRGYQILDDLQKYYDEEMDTFDIPKEIDGWPVVKVEGEYIVGGPLLNHSDDIWPIEFESTDDPNVVEWLNDAGKNDKHIIDHINSVITES